MIIKHQSFAKRDAEKKSLREHDIAAVKNGASAQKVRKRNFMFSRLDMSKVVAVAPNRHHFSHPK